MTNIPLEDRIRWVGSSESAVLLGCSPFSTPFTLWHEKAGNIPPESLDHLERIQAGKYLEPAIAAWASHKWGWPLKTVSEYLQHPSVAGFGASLDFETETGEPVEIKNVDFIVFRDEWGSEGETIIDAPIHYLIQLQHQLACRPGADHGWLLVCVGGNRLYRMQVSRHAGVIARIEREVEAFWRSIHENTPPKPDFTQDGSTIASLYAAGNGQILDLTHNNRFPDLCAAYLAGKEREKEGRRAAEAALAEIRAEIGEASGAICSGYRIKTADIAETPVPATTRRAYRRWTIKTNEGVSS